MPKWSAGAMFLDAWVFPCNINSESKTCPQCRYKTKQRHIHRVYFNVQTNDEPDDPNALPNHINNLKFMINLKDTEIKNAQEENITLKSRNDELRDEYKNIENKCSALEMSMSALKEQMVLIKQHCSEAEKARTKAEEAQIKAEEGRIEAENTLNWAQQMHTHLERLTNFELIIKGTASEVEKVVNDSSGCLDTLAIWVVVLKGQFIINFSGQNEPHRREAETRVPGRATLPDAPGATRIVRTARGGRANYAARGLKAKGRGTRHIVHKRITRNRELNMSDELSEKLEVLQKEKTHLQNEKTHLQNEKTHLQNELAGHAATVLYLKKDLDYSVAANRSLRKKLIELEMASLSPVASSQSSLPHLIAENPAPSGFIDPRDDQDVNTV
uniref:Uncharacterized protein n=1 Tax=Timema bartmani TaxID=61472 RepID=A0A7R9F4E6_9NEOP|nr:unnamed protein product [Timema bartmani]